MNGFEPERDPENLLASGARPGRGCPQYQIIGEAVNKIQNTTPDSIKAHPGIPWNDMRGVRNIAIHEYFLLIEDSVDHREK